jgi:hypothetical protein
MQQSIHFYTISRVRLTHEDSNLWIIGQRERNQTLMLQKSSETDPVGTPEKPGSGTFSMQNTRYANPACGGTGLRSW